MWIVACESTTVTNTVTKRNFEVVFQCCVVVISDQFNEGTVYGTSVSGLCYLQK